MDSPINERLCEFLILSFFLFFLVVLSKAQGTWAHAYNTVLPTYLLHGLLPSFFYQGFSKNIHTKNLSHDFLLNLKHILSNFHFSLFPPFSSKNNQNILPQQPPHPKDQHPVPMSEFATVRTIQPNPHLPSLWDHVASRLNNILLFTK